MRAVIIASGNISNYNYVKEKITSEDFIICADGGTNHASKMNIKPDIIIGDLDSSNKKNIEEYTLKGVELYEYKSEKDETDTELAVRYVIEKGYKEVLLFGCLGTRFDHAYANVSLLKVCLDNNIKSCILDYYSEIYITNKIFELQGNEGDLVSLLPLSEKVTGVTTYYLKYELIDADIYLGKPIGVSNVMLGDICKVKINNGLLLIIKSKD